MSDTSDEGGRDVLAELDSIKAHVDQAVGEGEDGDQAGPTTVTPRSRFEEHFAAFRHSLAHILDRGDEA